MRYIVDTDAATFTFEKDGKPTILPLYSDEAFQYLSHQWLKVGWNQKYPYTFTWMGRPIIQIPEDMVRLQEVIYQVKPDIILETGIAHGGSLVFSASLCKSIGHGKVIGVDIDIRPPNRKAIESHPLFPLITLIEGSSIAPETVEKVKKQIAPQDRVLAIFDSNHAKNHVLAELEAYHTLVPSGSYLVVTDGFMKDLYDVPRGKKEWKDNNPYVAIQIFLNGHPEFQLDSPSWLFNESQLSENITHWPNAWLKRK